MKMNDLVIYVYLRIQLGGLDHTTNFRQLFDFYRNQKVIQKRLNHLTQSHF